MKIAHVLNGSSKNHLQSDNHYRDHIHDIFLARKMVYPSIIWCAPFNTTAIHLCRRRRCCCCCCFFFSLVVWLLFAEASSPNGEAMDMNSGHMSQPMHVSIVTRIGFGRQQRKQQRIPIHTLALISGVFEMSSA